MLRHLRRRFLRDARGTVAIITAIVIFPLLFLAIGVPIDLARAIQLRSAFQNFDDAAALAGELDIANGATAGQACILVYTMGAATIYTPAGGLPTLGVGASTSPGSSCSSTPQTSVTTAPNSVTVTATASPPLATTFTSFLKPSMAVSTSATAMGPQGFITICITPTPSRSSDLNQAYYYLRNPNGTFVNQDGTQIEPADYPGLYVGPTTSGVLPVPTTNPGIELSAFLTDNAYPTANGPNSPSGYCDAAHTQIAVTIKNGLGQRLGFEFVNVTGGQYPCYYDPNGISLSGSCLTNNGGKGTLYAYNPASTTYSLTGGNANGFENFYLAYGAPLTYLTNAYGSFIGEQNFFFSTDYPSTYTTSNQNIAIKSPITGAALITSPVANNPCYETLQALGALSPTINGYSYASQGCLLSQSPPYVGKAIVNQYNSSPDATVVFGYTNNGKTGYMVCLAQDGADKLSGTTYTPTTVSGSGDVYVTGTTSTTKVQQENLILANSSTVSPSLGANVYQCPVNTIGNPYFPDPTCAELKGATLNVGWNDMGGFGTDNGTSPADLEYSYSCQPVQAGALTETALTQ